MAQIKFLKGVDAQLNSVNIKDGQILFTTDKGKIYLDNGSTRIELYKKDFESILNEIGNLTDLTTVDKTNLVNAINEILEAVEKGGAGSKVTIDTDTITEGMAKSYTIKQGANVVGIIDIPKDMVISTAEIVTDPEGQAPGTYLKITIANSSNDSVYINVADLVDAYTAEKNATQVQLTINDANEISATIVANSIGSNELAINAVETNKIKDRAVTKDKIADNAITQDKIAPDAIGPDELADNAVDTAAILNGSVTLDKLNDDVKDLLSGIEWGDFAPSIAI